MHNQLDGIADVLIHLWGSALLLLPLAFPPMLVAIRLKWLLMTVGGFRMQYVARQKLSFFRWDVVVSLVVLPLLFAYLVRHFGPFWGAVLAALSSFSATLVLLAQVLSVEAVGQMTSASSMLDGAHFAVQDPRIRSAYVGRRNILFALGCMIVLLGWPVLVSAFLRQLEQSLNRGGLWWTLVLTLYWAVCLVPAVVSFPTVPKTRSHQSALFLAIRKLVGNDDDGTAEFNHLDSADLLREYRSLTRTPERQTQEHMWGAARSFNVLFFILETGPARCLPLDKDLSEFPALARLRQDSLIGLMHHTTAPLTSRAIFSIFTSWYPVSSPTDFIQLNPASKVPGLMNSLNSQGYRTAFYSPKQPHVLFRLDDARLRSYGFQSLVWPPAEKTDIRRFKKDWESRLALDNSAIEMCRADLRKWAAANERFAIGLLPQVSHAPWPDVTGGEVSDIPARGRAMLALQDKMISDLIEELEMTGQLDKTIIIVTSDHGIRALGEDPALGFGKIDAYSFHVPLLIRVPGLLESTRTIPWVTSHIDLAPTVLDLLGIDVNRESEQGLPVWDQRLENRVTHFFAKWYLGADGFVENGNYYMLQHDDDAVYRSQDMHFEPSAMLDPKTPDHSAAATKVRRMGAFQRAWTERMTAGIDFTNPVDPR